VQGEYKLERGLFDAWARWVDNCNRAAILAHWYPRQDSTSRLADRYGKPETAPVEYLITQEEQQARSDAVAHLDHALDSERCEQVDDFMSDLQGTHPRSHLCLTARHRRVIGNLRIGKKANGKRYWPEEVAVMVLGARFTGETALLAFESECRFGYRGLQIKLGLPHETA
jgi:hypothetical protein